MLRIRIFVDLRGRAAFRLVVEGLQLPPVGPFKIGAAAAGAKGAAAAAGDRFDGPGRGFDVHKADDDALLVFIAFVGERLYFLNSTEIFAEKFPNLHDVRICGEICYFHMSRFPGHSAVDAKKNRFFGKNDQNCSKIWKVHFYFNFQQKFSSPRHFFVGNFVEKFQNETKKFFLRSSFRFFGFGKIFLKIFRFFWTEKIFSARSKKKAFNKNTLKNMKNTANTLFSVYFVYAGKRKTFST